jgi:hypothetical protein
MGESDALVLDIEKLLASLSVRPDS